MKIVILLSVSFILIFILLLCAFRSDNKKEKVKDSFMLLVIGTALFSAVITAALAFLLFLIIGSTSIIDSLFSLNINMNQIIIISISIFIYWITLDNIFENLFEYIFGKNLFALLFLALARITAFYIMGNILKLDETINMTISIGVSLILLLFDMLLISE